MGILHKKPKVILMLKKFGQVEFLLNRKRVTVKFYRFSEEQTTVRWAKLLQFRKAFF